MKKNEIEKMLEILKNPTYKILFDKKNFKTPEVYSFNHINMKIDTIFENSYEEDNKGYICHRLNLIHDKKAIGYIKVFYLKKETFDKMNPDIFHFMDNLKGHLFGLSTHPRKIDVNKDNNYWTKKSEIEKKKTLEKIGLTFSNEEYNYVCENKDNLSTEEMYQRLLKKANKNSLFKNQYQNYIENNIDKPVIEFSKIRGKNESMNQRFWSENIFKYCENKNISIEELTSTEIDINYRRKGLAQKMYILMADWLALNNLNLYKGGTNSMSEPLWTKSMKNNKEINVIEKNNKIYIDHTNKDLSYLIKKEKKLKRNL